MTKGLLSKVWNWRFTTVLDVQGNEERVAQTTCKIAFRDSWTSDHHEMTKGLLGPRATFRFGAGNDERVARTTCKIWVWPQFSGIQRPWNGCLRCCPAEPTPGQKRKKFWRREDFSKSSHPQHTFLSSLSHQASSAAILSSYPPRPSSAAILKLLVILLWSGVGGQLLVNYWTSICCGHESWVGGRLFVNYCSSVNFLSSTSCGHLWHPLAVVRGWWSAIQRKFRSLTSDNMDSWKSRAE